MLSLMIEYGGRGTLFGLSPIELAQYRAAAVRDAELRVTELEARRDQLHEELVAARTAEATRSTRGNRKQAREAAAAAKREREADDAAARAADDAARKAAAIDARGLGRGMRQRKPRAFDDDNDDDDKTAAVDDDNDELDDRAVRRRAASQHTAARGAAEVRRLDAAHAAASTDVVDAEVARNVAIVAAQAAFNRAYDASNHPTPTPAPQFVNKRQYDIDSDNMLAHLALKYGQSNGYFDCDLLCVQLEHAMDIARAKFGDVDVAFLLDHSANHFATAPDGLNSYSMNKSDNTDTQPSIRDTMFVDSEGKTRKQKIGKRGLTSVLTERAIPIVDGNGRALTVDVLRALLAKQPDFLAEKSRVETLAAKHNMTILRGVMNANGHRAIFCLLICLFIGEVSSRIDAD